MSVVFVGESIQEYFEYRERFPELLKDAHGFSHLTSLRQVEGFKVSELYYSDKVDAAGELMDAFNRSLILGTYAGEQPKWPVMLRKNWGEL